MDQGRELVWYPGDDGAPLMLVRSVVLGPMMALSLTGRGLLCLHGSAVALDGGVAAFLAPKFYGKSTLALMLAAAGARLVADDMVVVDPGPPTTVRPGVHSVRLLPDAAERLRGSIGTMVEGLKPTVTRLPDSRLAWESRALETIYLLEPSASNHGPAVRRTPVGPAEAAAVLAVHNKLPEPLVGLAAASVTLRQIASVVGATPVYRLHVVRDVDRLEDVTRQLLEWHRAPGVEDSPAAAAAGR